jgi:hypothetical protein|tara:strand:+ start:767 stop:958 length:192 start_codon:yes stop_codon:yes gene_type:complete
MALTFRIAKDNNKAREKLGIVLENLEKLLEELRASKDEIKWKSVEGKIAIVHKQVIKAHDLIV